MTKLSVRDLRVTFGSERGPVHAVRGVDFDVESGRTLCLVGESGSGKSATAGAVINLLPPSATVSGQVTLDGQQLLGLSDQELSAVRGRRIGMVFQDPLSALTPMFTVGQQLADAVRVHQRVGRKQAWQRAVELLDLVGIAEPGRRSHSFPHEFSGGMRQRVVIALAIANDPDLLIADEPTTALDVTVQAQILQVLQTAQRETGAGLLLITHDLGVVAGYADEVAVMYAGRIVEKASVTETFTEPRMPYTVGLLGAVPTAVASDRQPLLAIAGEPPQLLQVPTGCPFAPRCPAAIDECLDGEPALLAADDDHAVACRRAAEITGGDLDVASLFDRGPRPAGARPTEAAEAVLDVRGLMKSYPITKGSVLRRRVGTNVAVRGVDLRIAAGETLGLVGESGSGKTSTLMELLRLRPPESGTVELLGRPVTGDLGPADRRAIRSGVQLVMQDPTGSLSPRLTVFDVVAEPLQAAGRSRAEIQHRVYELLDLVGLHRSVVDRFPTAFSGGQRQRIGIARALALQPRLVILDEPVSSLDVSVQADILNLLVRLQDQLGISYLLVAHDLSVVRYLSDQVSVMYLGTIVESASAAELFERPQHPYTRALLSASPVPDPSIERKRQRIVLTGEAVADTDTGCVFRQRCPLHPTLPDQQQQRCRRPQTLQLSPPQAAPTAVDRSIHRVACHAVAEG